MIHSRSDTTEWDHWVIGMTSMKLIDPDAPNIDFTINFEPTRTDGEVEHKSNVPETPRPQVVRLFITLDTGAALLSHFEA